MPSYAYLAVCRAEEEKQLSLSFQRSDDHIFAVTQKYFVPSKTNTSVDYLIPALQDGLKRLLMPSLERELRAEKKRRSDEAAIRVFGENIKQLLLTAPVRGKRVL